jgi:hypothetical protein
VELYNEVTAASTHHENITIVADGVGVAQMVGLCFLELL